MTPKERTARALRREPVDRLPIQINYTGLMGRRLAAHWGISPADLPNRLDNHLLRLDITRTPRLSADGKVSYDWWGAGWGTETEGYWHAFAPLAEPSELAAFPWPDPEDPHLLDDACRILANDGGQRFVVPNFGFALFERAWSLRGFDQFLMDLIAEPAWAEDLLERITEIQLALAHRFVALRAPRGPNPHGQDLLPPSPSPVEGSPAAVDGGYFGDDYGAQKSLLIAPGLWRRMIKPRLSRLFAVFRNAGLPVILHSDGDIWPILPDLVDIGLSCLNPVQPEVLRHPRLHREFGRHLSFYGGISTQDVLPHGSPADVTAAVRSCLRELAPRGTGLLFGPSHRLQSDVPVANVLAMLTAVGLPHNS